MNASSGGSAEHDAGPGHLEREVKLAAWPGFALPDLDRVVPWVNAGAASEDVLDAVYVDTPDLRLVRWGITVRHRQGGGEDGWTVKLPSFDGTEGSAGGLARAEHAFPGDVAAVPPGALELLRAFVRRAELGPVAHLHTRRRTLALLDGGGRPVGEVDDDEVSVLDGERVAARFREIEVEIGPSVPATLLDAVVARLREAGAGAPDPTPKLVRALGPRALAAPEVSSPELGDEATVGDVVRHAMASGVRRILVHDPLVRLDTGAEAVHQMRVGTRRLRSDLRTFHRVLEPGWADGWRDELKWLAGVLGEVRDADVLDERLCAACRQLDRTDTAHATILLRRLGGHRAAAYERLSAALQADRYVALLDQLVAAAAAPALVAEAEEPAREALPELVRKPWRKLVEEVAGLPDDPPDEALHHVRIRAKRARYAAEAASVVVPKAARHAKAIAGLQGVLGDHHDAVVAEQWLRSEAAELHGSDAVAAGVLVAAQRADAARLRGEWRSAWKEASRRKVAGWLHG